MTARRGRERVEEVGLERRVSGKGGEKGEGKRSPLILHLLLLLSSSSSSSFFSR